MGALAVLGGKAVGKMKVPKWPIYDESDINAVSETIKSGIWGINGKKQEELEEKFAGYCNVKYGIAAANGTITLRLALEALGIEHGDEVIVPGLTWQATAAAVLDVNAVPILVDIDADTYAIDPRAVEAAITSRTRCIIPVHLYGRMADMDSIMSIANKHGLSVIEDSAHQHGSRWRDKPAGSIGDIGSFSFQSSKILNSGEGGFLTTNDPRLNYLLQSLKNCGRSYDDGRTFMQSGNYRMTELQAALLISQLSRLEEQNALRDRNAQYIEKHILQIEGIKPMYRNPNITMQAYYHFTLRYDPEAWENVPKNIFMEALISELSNQNIVRVDTYSPLNNCPLYRPYSKNTHKLSEEYWKRINPERFSLPFCKKAFEEESLNFFHTLLLTDREGCDIFIEAIRKLRSNINELKKYSMDRM
jgi:L-glutamine:2-deoxy-scyllo-inosose/3-amino-2,3-dideoxy-scyllo-inosose aminotransferase